MSAVRYDSSTVAEVKRLAEAGWSHRRIRELMHKQRGHAPSFETIARWLNPRYAEASRARVRRRELAIRSRSWSFRLPGPGGRQTGAYQEEFVRRLDAADLGANSIAKVCSIVFGERWSRYRVQKVLGRERSGA
jgi:hypothetical protein